MFSSRLSGQFVDRRFWGFLDSISDRLLSQSGRRVRWLSSVLFVALSVIFVGLAFWQASELEQAIQAGVSAHAQWTTSLAHRVFWQVERERLPILLFVLLLFGCIGWFTRNLVHHLTRLRQYQAVTVQVQHDLLNQDSPQIMYQRLVDRVVAQTEAIGAYIVARDSEGQFLTMEAMADADVGPLSDGAVSGRCPVQGICPTVVAGEVFGTGLQLGPLNPHLASVAQNANDGRRTFERVRSVMAIPVFVDEPNVPFVVLVIESAEFRHFTRLLQDTLRQLASSLGLGLSRYFEQRELERAKAEIENLARHDTLTGLPNRRFLGEQLEQAMARATSHAKLLAVCILDLDGFKPVNDAYGHEAGDEVLVTLGKRLLGTLRKADFVARLGGDEFVLLVEDLAGPNDLAPILTRVEEVMNTPIPLGNGKNIQIAGSMGIALYPFGKEETGDQLLRSADLALYERKSNKTDREHFWAVGDKNAAREWQRTPAQYLLDAGALEVWYQPVLSGASRNVAGVEALARLRDDNGSILYPADFLPQLSVDDLTKLSSMVLTQALEDLKELDKLGWSLWVSFNFAPESFCRNCVPSLQGVISASGVDPKRITLEILESSDFLERNVSLSVLHDIKGMGVRLALDDIGSAYASLLRLKELPIDEIKLDQGFVRFLRERPQDLPFVRTIQDLASDLQLDLVVEGVETTEILDAMLTMGVPYLQGYAISKPLPLSGLQQFLSGYVMDTGRHPARLFGLYAGTLKLHAAIKNMLLINATQLDIASLVDGHQCRGHSVLHRFGYGDDSHLVQLHNTYHRALGAIARDTGNHSSWKLMESALNEFLQALLEDDSKGGFASKIGNPRV